MFKVRKTWLEVSPKLINDVRQEGLTDQAIDGAYFVVSGFKIREGSEKQITNIIRINTSIWEDSINERETKAEAGGFTPLMDDIVKELGLISAAIWGYVWRHAQQENNVCTASTERIADDLGLSRRTIIRHLQILVDRGYLKDHTPNLKNKPHTYSVIMPDELTTNNSGNGAKANG